MNNFDLEACIRRVAWRGPSAGLRNRVMTDARIAGTPVAWIDRIWFSRTWRYSTVAAVALLTAIAAWPAPEPELAQTAAGRAAFTFIQEVATEAGFEPGHAAALARRTVTRSKVPAMAYDLRMAESFLERGDR